MSEKIKDSLMINVPHPRIIFIGGSNMALGLDSKIIKDSLHLNPINTSISIGLGAKYMFQHNLEYLRPTDIVVAALEYENYVNEWDIGTEDLASLVFDVSFRNLRFLSVKQIFKMIVPGLSIRWWSRYNTLKNKLKNKSIIDISNIYNKYSFNEFGDNYKHWEEKSDLSIKNYAIQGKLNHEVFEKLKKIEKMINKRGARLLITYPCLNFSSIKLSEKIITDIQKELEQNFHVLGTPLRYSIPDTLLFDSPYHPVKKGIDIRTNNLIEDIRNEINNN
jgi:hypothetical protein